MKDWKKKFLALTLILGMIFAMWPQAVIQADSKPAPTITKKTLYVGYENYTIKMKNLAKDGKVTYATSDKKVVTVTSKGVMKPVATGKATVTVTVTQSKKTYKSKIAVTVKNPSVLISNKIATLSVGESYQFVGKTYGLSKEKTSLTWTSSKPKVATVDAKTGKMKAIAKGTTTITLKDKTSGKKSTCKVTVTEKEDSKGALEKTEIGDTVIFGSYEQDNDTSNGVEPIEWIVLDKKDGKVLLLSKYALDRKSYNEGYGDVTWETCTLRSWLNDEFYKAAFSSEERKFIATTNVKNEDNPEYGTEGGNDTKDKVFLLSIGEVTTHFNSNPDGYDPMMCHTQITDYAKAKGEVIYGDSWVDSNAGSSFEEYEYDSEWFLRSPGRDSSAAATVDYSVNQSGSGARFGEDVRPALWLEESAPAVTLNKEPEQVSGSRVTFSGKTVALEKAQIGDTVIFGSYEQDNVISNGVEPIEWLVLDKKDGKVLLLSKYTLDCQRYNGISWSHVTWETCWLRRWLNNQFYKAAFSEAERELIALTNVKNEDNPKDETEGGNNTRDKVFLLSIGEVTTYFNPDPDEKDPARRAQMTEYAKAQFGEWGMDIWVYSEEKYGWYGTTEYDGSSRWWLRTPFHIYNWDYAFASAISVNMQGGIEWGYDTENGKISEAVRPALWLNLEP